MWARGQGLRMESIIPSSWKWGWETPICSPVGLIGANRPFTTVSIGSMWPCGHTTKWPRLSSAVMTHSLIFYLDFNVNVVSNHFPFYVNNDKVPHPACKVIIQCMATDFYSNSRLQLIPEFTKSDIIFYFIPEFTKSGVIFYFLCSPKTCNS